MRLNLLLAWGTSGEEAPRYWRTESEDGTRVNRRAIHVAVQVSAVHRGLSRSRSRCRSPEGRRERRRFDVSGERAYKRRRYASSYDRRESLSPIRRSRSSASVREDWLERQYSRLYSRHFLGSLVSSKCLRQKRASRRLG